MSEKGIFYGVGVGPGDPELLTLKAINTIRNADIIVLPDSSAKENAAYKIAEEYIKDKQLVYVDMPMIRDKQKLDESHDKAADTVAEYLDKGKNAAFLTLGDPTVYSTIMYVHKRLKQRGYKTVIIPGVPSFCAVAAALDTSLCEGGQPLHIIPASYADTDKALDYDGNKVLMKSGKSISKVKQKINDKNLNAMMVECCGMENQKIHETLDDVDETASYFSVIVIKNDNE